MKTSQMRRSYSALKAAAQAFYDGGYVIHNGSCPLSSWGADEESPGDLKCHCGLFQKDKTLREQLGIPPRDAHPNLEDESKRHHPSTVNPFAHDSEGARLANEKRRRVTVRSRRTRR